ncbi:MAG: 2-oxoglutarate dehydrogenase, E2 component, dihydrolipoamide succinyltransferase [Armatimonadota bacterium]
MPVEILMPELGESVHEGTVSRWLKKVGEAVQEDEPIVEIMTDKVNTELPSPASGVLSEILIQEGEMVEVFAVMGRIDPAVAAAPTKALEPEIPGATQGEAKPAPPAPAPVTKPSAPDVTPVVDAPIAGEGERRFFTPVVRAMAKEAGLSEAQIATIAGSGEGGRVTKRDLEAFLARPAPKKSVTSAPKVALTADQELVPLVGMRKMIAEAMVRSSQVPVVTTITDADVTNMVKFRELNKESFLATHGVKLTYTPFFLKALSEALMEFPIVNASLREDNQVVMNRSVHLGVAVALGAKGEGGLIAPVIRDCHTKGLVQIAKDLEEIARKSRANQLGVADVQGGTFTLTNPGTYGALFGTPMINAPQGGILGAYAIKKAPVIVDDMIAIRSMMNLSLSFDHRALDGLAAARFLQQVRNWLEHVTHDQV